MRVLALALLAAVLLGAAAQRKTRFRMTTGEPPSRRPFRPRPTGEPSTGRPFRPRPTGEPVDTEAPTVPPVETEEVEPLTDAVVLETTEPEIVEVSDTAQDDEEEEGSGSEMEEEEDEEDEADSASMCSPNKRNRKIKKIGKRNKAVLKRTKKLAKKITKKAKKVARHGARPAALNRLTSRLQTVRRRGQAPVSNLLRMHRSSRPAAGRPGMLPTHKRLSEVDDLADQCENVTCDDLPEDCENPIHFASDCCPTCSDLDDDVQSPCDDVDCVGDEVCSVKDGIAVCCSEMPHHPLDLMAMHVKQSERPRGGRPGALRRPGAQGMKARGNARPMVRGRQQLKQRGNMQRRPSGRGAMHPFARRPRPSFSRPIGAPLQPRVAAVLRQLLGLNRAFRANSGGYTNKLRARGRFNDDRRSRWNSRPQLKNSRRPEAQRDQRPAQYRRQKQQEQQRRPGQFNLWSNGDDNDRDEQAERPERRPQHRRNTQSRDDQPRRRQQREAADEEEPTQTAQRGNNRQQRRPAARPRGRPSPMGRLVNRRPSGPRQRGHHLKRLLTFLGHSQDACTRDSCAEGEKCVAVRGAAMCCSARSTSHQQSNRRPRPDRPGHQERPERPNGQRRPNRPDGPRRPRPDRPVGADGNGTQNGTVGRPGRPAGRRAFSRPVPGRPDAMARPTQEPEADNASLAVEDDEVQVLGYCRLPSSPVYKSYFKERGCHCQTLKHCVSELDDTDDGEVEASDEAEEPTEEAVTDAPEDVDEMTEETPTEMTEDGSGLGSGLGSGSDTLTDGREEEPTKGDDFDLVFSLRDDPPSDVADVYFRGRGADAGHNRAARLPSRGRARAGGDAARGRGRAQVGRARSHRNRQQMMAPRKTAARNPLKSMRYAMKIVIKQQCLCPAMTASHQTRQRKRNARLGARVKKLMRQHSCRRAGGM